MKHNAIVIVLSSLFFVGCATKPAPIQPGAHLLSATDTQPGSTYELGVYVLASGDTVAIVCNQFQIGIRDFMTINPGLNATRLKVGQEVRVYERIKQ